MVVYLDYSLNLYSAPKKILRVKLLLLLLELVIKKCPKGVLEHRYHPADHLADRPFCRPGVAGYPSEAVLNYLRKS